MRTEGGDFFLLCEERRRASVATAPRVRRRRSPFLVRKVRYKEAMSDHRWGTREDAVWWPNEQNREDGRTQALFQYKMPNFQQSQCAAPQPSCMRSYENEYRGVVRPDGSAAVAAATTGWWYPGMQGGMQNVPAPIMVCTSFLFLLLFDQADVNFRIW